MTNKELLYIITISELGNFSLAAEKLNISQSALSQAVRKVEDELGFKLFFRGGTKTRATSLGKQVLQYGKPVLEKWISFENKLNDYSNLNESHLNVYAPPLFCKSFIPEVVKSFGEKHPNITVNVVEASNSSEAERMAESEIADISLVWEPVANGSLSRIPVFKSELLLAVPSSNPLCASKPFTDFEHIPYIDMDEVGSLKDFPFSLTSYSRTRTIVQSFIDSLDFEPIIKEQTSVWSYLIDYVINGERIALIDELECTSNTVGLQNLAFYRIRNANLDHSVVACFCSGKVLSKAVHLFLDELKAYPSIASRPF